MPRRLLLVGAAVVVLGVGGVAAAVAADGDTVPQGVRVDAIDVSGLSRAAAETRIAEGLRERVSTPLTLVADDQQLALDPARAGLTVDAAATADEALSAGPLSRLRAVFGVGRDVEPVVSVDEPTLEDALRSLAPKVDRKPREGSIAFDEKPEPVPTFPLTGRTLDVEAAAERVAEQWLDGRRIELPVDVEQVETTEQDVRRAIDEIAAPAVAAPVTVDVEGDDLVVPPTAIAAALKVQLVDGAFAPRLDGAVLREQLRSELRRIGDPPKDATFDVSSGTPVVVPSTNGRSVSAADLVAAVQPVLTKAAPRTASAPLTAAEARITTAKAKTLGVQEVLGSFTTRHPCCRPRVQNIHRIAEIVDGAVLLPGDRFDLNEYVGPRDKARGFQEAPQILEGQFVDRVGGGVSQFATTLFNAVFFSGLKDITHTPHSYYIRRYPPGREATVSFPLPDLIFENDSPHGVFIDTSFTGTSITVTFWGTKRFDRVRAVTGPRTRLRDFGTEYVDRDDCTATEGEKGFDIVVTRVFEDDGRELRRERFRTRYKPEPRFICGPPPRRSSARSPSPSPSASPTASPTAAS